MYRSVVFGEPKKCPNRNCRAPFYKDSHRGWVPKTETEVFAIMHCSTCRDIFAVAQSISVVHGYFESLPSRKLPKNSISFSIEDHEEFRHELYADDNPLWALHDNISED